MSTTQTLPAKTKGPPTMESAKALEEIAGKYALANLAGQGRFERALMLSQGIRALNAAITPEMMALVMELKDTALGFLTDRPPGSKELETKGPYGEAAIKACFIEATLRGAYPVNNEWNLLAGRPYLTKNFFLRAVGEFPGLTNLRLRPGVPSAKTDGCLVPFSASWDRNGKSESIECVLHKKADGTEVDERIAVRVNQGMGVDAIIGKATRKILARIYADLTGSVRDDTEDGEIIEGTATPSAGANGRAMPEPAAPSESAEEISKRLKKEMAGPASQSVADKTTAVDTISTPSAKTIDAAFRALSYGDLDVFDYLDERYGLKEVKALNKDQRKAVMADLQAQALVKGISL